MLNATAARIRQGKIASVYFLYGPNEFGIKEIIGALKENIVNGPMAQFNLDELSGQDLSWENIIERSRTLPMMAPRRLVIGWGADRLFRKSEKGLDEAERYFQAPCKETVLVLVAAAADQRLKIFKTLKNAEGVIEESKEPSRNEVPGIIKAFAKQQGKTIEDAAAHEIANLVGTEVMWLRNEVEKAAIFVGNRERITLEDVRVLLADIGAHEIWGLTDAIAKKDYVESMRLLESLFREGAQPVMILGVLLRQIRQLTQAKMLMNARLGIRTIAGELKLPNFVLEKTIGYAKGFREQELYYIYRRIAETDLHLKSSPQPPRLILEALIADICLG